MSLHGLLFEHEAAIRNAAFYGVIIVIALWEVLSPRRGLTHSIRVRWLNNIGLGLTNIFLARWVIPAAGISVAIVVEERGWGLLNHLPAPMWVLAGLAILALDLIKYIEHRIFHSVHLLWRVHLVHHADLDVDFTTGYRHHPIERLIAAPVYLTAVLALGVPPVAVLIFEVVGSLAAVYTHGNIVGVGTTADRVLRTVIVTPAMHFVHHSALRRETDSNYGLIFSCWDRLFGTYCERPAAGYQGMTIGLEYFRDTKHLYLHRILALPFIEPDKTAVVAESGGGT